MRFCLHHHHLKKAPYNKLVRTLADLQYPMLCSKSILLIENILVEVATGKHLDL